MFNMRNMQEKLQALDEHPENSQSGKQAVNRLSRKKKQKQKPFKQKSIFKRQKSRLTIIG